MEEEEEIKNIAKGMNLYHVSKLRTLERAINAAIESTGQLDKLAAVTRGASELLSEGWAGDVICALKNPDSAALEHGRDYLQKLIAACLEPYHEARKKRPMPPFQFPDISQLLKRPSVDYSAFEDIINRPGAFRKVDPIPDEKPAFLFRKTKANWHVTYNGKSDVISHLVGMTYIAELVAHPHVPMPATTLAAMISLQPAAAVSPNERIISPKALDEMKKRIRELQVDLAQAQAEGNEVIELEIEKELSQLLAECSRVTGLGGKLRETGDAERARQRVKSAIGRAVTKINEPLPELAQHLQNCIEQGEVLIYRPDRSIDWQF